MCYHISIYKYLFDFVKLLLLFPLQLQIKDNVSDCAKMIAYLQLCVMYRIAKEPWKIHRAMDWWNSHRTIIGPWNNHRALE